MYNVAHADSAHDFNPRSSYEERRHPRHVSARAQRISIHAPHTRSDLRASSEHETVLEISIHAPHTRSDFCTFMMIPLFSDFNPRSSYEERLRLE